MKTTLLIVGIIIGFTIFILGSNLLKNSISSKNNLNYWESNIYIGHSKLDMTPKQLFNSFPYIEKYPRNKIVYYKLISKKEFNSRLVVETEVIQNREVILKYNFYFDRDKYLKLNIIEETDKTTGKTTQIKYEEDIKIFLNTYKGFIDLYLSSDFK